MAGSNLTPEQAEELLAVLNRFPAELVVVLRSRIEGERRSYIVEYQLDGLTFDQVEKLVEAVKPAAGEGVRRGHVESRRVALDDAPSSAWLVLTGSD